MKNIRWIIQNNLSRENWDFDKMTQVCKDFGFESEGVQIIPFFPGIPEFTQDEKINIYYGATTFIENVYNQFNKPIGVFFDEDTFSIEKYLNVWGEYMLSSDGRLTTLKEFSAESHEDETLFFVRPDADDKSFNGEVRTFAEIKNLLSNIIKADNVTLNEDTKIIVSTPYKIAKEWRNYIVDGKVITSSLYRKNFRLYKDGNDIPPEMIKFVEDRCKEYMPHKIFAMDIALCGGDYYIIECGCMNSVGLYHCDISKFVKAISDYVINN